MGLRRGAHLPDIGRWARRWIDHWVCYAWPVRRQTYGYLPSRRASPPFGRYHIILLGVRGTWVWTTCPELLLGSGLAGSRTRDLSITSQRPNHWATKPPVHGEQVINVISNNSDLRLQLLCWNCRQELHQLQAVEYLLHFHAYRPKEQRWVNQLNIPHT